MAYDKKELRRQILALRDSLGEEEVACKSELIINKITSMEIYNKSKFIMSYVDFRNEVKTQEFIEASLESGKRVAVPLTGKDEKGNRIIIPCEILNIKYELERNSFGILEPKKEYRRAINPMELDLIIVPGVAFDLRKNRIGYGAGYYDRFLAFVRKDCIKLGVAFDFQVVEEIDAKSHDISVDIIVTEKRLIV